MNLKIFSGESNPKLSQDICERLGIQLGEIYHHTFGSGEKYSQFKSNIRGDDVFLIQGMGNGSSNDNLMQLLIMADAARRSSASRITAVLSYFPYSRQERKTKSRTPISAKLVMDILQAAGIDRILTMDLHAPQIQGFTNLPCDCLVFEPILKSYIKNKYTDNIVIVAPDVGAVKKAESYSKSLNCELALIVKTRISDDKVSLESFVGNVEGKTAIIIDDLTESCGTLIQAATVCKEKGASKVVCGITHGCFTSDGIKRLQSACDTSNIINEFIYSDTIAGDKIVSYFDKITQLSVSELFAKAIKNIHENKSISELFD